MQTQTGGEGETIQLQNENIQNPSEFDVNITPKDGDPNKPVKKTATVPTQQEAEAQQQQSQLQNGPTLQEENEGQQEVANQETEGQAEEGQAENEQEQEDLNQEDLDQKVQTTNDSEQANPSDDLIHIDNVTFGDPVELGSSVKESEDKHISSTVLNEPTYEAVPGKPGVYVEKKPAQSLNEQYKGTPIEVKPDGKVVVNTKTKTNLVEKPEKTVNTGLNGEGIYTYGNSKYKYKGGAWYKDVYRDGKYVKIQQNVAARSAELNKNAVRVGGLPSKGFDGDGLYTYSGNPKAVYKHQYNTWYIDAKGTGNFVKITQNVASRSAQLNKNAVKVKQNKSAVFGTANVIINDRLGDVVSDFRKEDLVTASGNVATTQGLSFSQLTKSNIGSKTEKYNPDGTVNFNYDPNYASASPAAKTLINTAQTVKAKPDGIYRYEDRPGVLYKKEKSVWYIDPTGKGQSYQKLTQDVAKRESLLEANAVPVVRDALNKMVVTTPNAIIQQFIANPTANPTPTLSFTPEGRAKILQSATGMILNDLNNNATKEVLSSSFEQGKNFAGKDIMYMFGKDNILSPQQREDLIKKQQEVDKIIGNGEYSDLKAASIQKILKDTEEYFNNAKEINEKINQAYSSNKSLDRYLLEEKRKIYMSRLNLSNNTDFQEYASKTFESTLKMADFILDGIEDGKLLYDRQNGGYKFSENITPTERKYYEGKLSEMIKEYHGVLDERFSSINSEIQDSKIELRTNNARIENIKKELEGVTPHSQEYKDLYSEWYSLKKKNESLDKSIDNKESLKSTVFLTEPKKLAVSLKATDTAKNIFNAIPSDITPKQKFDIFYETLSEKNEQLAKANKLNTGSLGDMTRGLKDIFDWGGYASLNDAEKEYVKNLATLNKLAPLYLNNDFGFTQSSGGWYESFMNGVGNLFQPVTAEADGFFAQSKAAQDIQKVFEEEGFNANDVVDDNYINALKEKANVEFWSAESWGNMLGTTVGVIAPLIITKKIPSSALKVAGRVESLITKTKNAETAALYLKRADDVFETALKSTKYGKYLVEPIKTGLEFELTGRVFGDTRDEMYFLSGFAGGVASEAFAGLIAKMPTDKAYSYVKGIFGENTDRAVEVLKKAGEVNVRGLTETAEEFGNELSNIYTDELRKKGFFDEVAERFGTLDKVQEFVISTYIMGAAFGLVDSDKHRAAYDALPEEKRKKVDEVLNYVREDINSANSKVDKYVDEQLDDSNRKEKVEKEQPVDVKDTPTGGIEFDTENIEKTSEGTPSTVDESKEDKASFTEPIDILNLEDYDKENQQGIPGEERKGEEPKQAEPVNGSSEETPSSSGVVQEEQGKTQQEVTPSAPLTEQQKESFKTELDDVIAPFKEGLSMANENNDPMMVKIYQDAVDEFESDPVSFINKMMESPATSTEERAKYQSVLDKISNQQTNAIDTTNAFQEIEATNKLKGSEKTKAVKELKAKYGTDYNRMSKINSNFDSIVRSLEKNNLIEKDCG